MQSVLLGGPCIHLMFFLPPVCNEAKFSSHMAPKHVHDDCPAKSGECEPCSTAVLLPPRPIATMSYKCEDKCFSAIEWNGCDARREHWVSGVVTTGAALSKQRGLWFGGCVCSVQRVIYIGSRLHRRPGTHGARDMEEAAEAWGSRGTTTAGLYLSIYLSPGKLNDLNESTWCRCKQPIQWGDTHTALGPVIKWVCSVELTLILPPSGKQELNLNVNLCLLISPISSSHVVLVFI